MSASTPPDRVVIESWLDRYRAFRCERSTARLGDYTRAFSRLREGLLPLQKRAAQRERDESPDFNVFRILRLARREVVTHTPFLTNLLNPTGSHAQDDLFLRVFWQRFATKRAEQAGHAQLPSLVAGFRWTVLVEQVTELGNFDIHLRCPSLGCQVVIENKIDAADQQDQLARYWAQIEKERTRIPHHFVVYLTPRPRDPVPTDLPLPPFTNLTYRSDISAILQTALGEITSPRLRHSLEQYLEVIHTL